MCCFVSSPYAVTLGMLIQVVFRELIIDLTQRSFSLAQKWSVLLLPRCLSSLTCCLCLILLWNAPTPCSLLLPSLLHLSLLLLWVNAGGSTSPASSPSLSSSSFALWAPSSLRQTAPFMKSVTWAGLEDPVTLPAMHPKPRCCGSYRNVWHSPASDSLFFPAFLVVFLQSGPSNQSPTPQLFTPALLHSWERIMYLRSIHCE